MRQQGNRPWHIEVNGINQVSRAEQTGHVSDLFWIWLAANLGILAVIYGGVILSFGMNFWQALIVVVLGAASFVLVGVLSVAGRDGGAPMMTLSRAIFGIHGNVVPNFVSWLSFIGWETISVITGTLALMALLGMFLPIPHVILAVLAMVIMVGLTIILGLLGHATLVVVQRWASYFFGLLTLLVIGLLIPKTHWHLLWSRPPGPWLSGFVPALSIIVAGTGLSWVNAAADYSRYLPRSVKSSAIIWSTVSGAALPLIVLMITGLLLTTQEPTLASAANPIQLIQQALPPWAAVPYLLTAAGGLICEADLSLYSSGLNLLNMFVPLPRYKTVLIDAVVMAGGTVYVVLIAKNFLEPFESFILLLGTGLAAWAGIFIADQLGRRKGVYDKDLLYGAAPPYQVRVDALIMWAVGTGAGLLCTSSPFFVGPLARGIFYGSSLELMVAFTVTLVGYLLLGLRTGNLHTVIEGAKGECE
ncbi:thiamine permease [Sulfobacillus sp. hq2]|nr:thiamine permease [Sulfobacillus sp. hq2]